LDLCEQKVLISSATQSYLTNSYTLFNGVPELFKHYSYTLRGIDTSFEFGVWEQFTSTAHYANFFVASQDQADNIVQQAKANSWLVTFQGKNSQGLYQVQVVVQAGPTGY
jgi:glucose-6-phosphate-specific signal transduction histidine kinase